MQRPRDGPGDGLGDVAGRRPAQHARLSEVAPTVLSMTISTDFTVTLAGIEPDIAAAAGEVTVTLVGPGGYDCGPNRDGQLSVDIWDPQVEDSDEYVVDLRRDPGTDPGEFLKSAAGAFLQWLRDHDVRVDEMERAPLARPGEQLVISASFAPQDWRSAAAATCRTPPHRTRRGQRPRLTGW
jgi:hypothetical protein